MLSRKKAEPQLTEKDQAIEFAELDPHYQQMLAYQEVPSWWYISILILSAVAALFCIYSLQSTLPW